MTTKRTRSVAEHWQADAKAFDRWFKKQRHSYGAVPTWTQLAEMKRVWCIARKSLRKKPNNNPT